jgi:hypothetical protein
MEIILLYFLSLWCSILIDSWNSDNWQFQGLQPRCLSNRSTFWTSLSCANCLLAHFLHTRSRCTLMLKWNVLVDYLQPLHTSFQSLMTNIVKGSTRLQVTGLLGLDYQAVQVERLQVVNKFRPVHYACRNFQCTGGVDWIAMELRVTGHGGLWGCGMLRIPGKEPPVPKILKVEWTPEPVWTIWRS